MRSPLDGIKVLDLTIFQNGPWATVMLSDMGAEVIKIEDPVNGDPGRNLQIAGGRPRPISTYFQTLNRNKKAITLDLKQREGREVFYTMAKTADVITQNFRVGVVEKLGIDYETIRKINPKIVYGSVSGFGPRGPHARHGVFDILGMARGGLMSLLSASLPDVHYDGHGGLADQTGAIILAYGVLLGIIARERYGIGQHIQTSQLGGQLMLQALAINGYLLNGEPPKPRFRTHMHNPLFNIYKCGDGKWIAMGGIQPDRYWKNFCKVLGIEHVADDPRYSTMEGRRQHPDEVIAVLDKAFLQRDRDAWLPLFQEYDILCAPVQGYADLPNDPQIIANGYFTELQHPVLGTLKEVGVPLTLSETPGAARAPAPEYGEHTEDVLLSYGYTWEQLTALRDKKVI